MSYSELRFHSSPLTHLCFLVSEALSGGRHERAPAPRQSSAAADRAEAEARAAAAAARRTASAPSWLDRLDQWAWRQTQKRHEAYLAQSTDLADLERRLRALERSVHLHAF
jgi:hypothetical protein